jgi:Phage integrase, N-terminal SAM-like domain
MSVPRLPPLQAPRLLDQVRERVRYLHYSLRTEQAYVHWMPAFVRFHCMRHPRQMGQPEVEAFLSGLAAERQVAVSTHRQTLSALLFLYQKVFGQNLPWMQSIGRPHRLAYPCPDALDRKYLQAGAPWPWFWVFPQAGHSVCPRTGGGGAVRSPLDVLAVGAGRRANQGLHLRVVKRLAGRTSGGERCV